MLSFVESGEVVSHVTIAPSQLPLRSSLKGKHDWIFVPSALPPSAWEEASYAWARDKAGRRWA